jgi:hypothetical protein
MNKIGLDNASYFETNGAKLGEIKAQLDSQSDKDKLEGMKRLIAVFFSVDQLAPTTYNPLDP